MKNYYPWNTQVLVDWLNQEFKQNNSSDLEAALNVPVSTIKSWLTESSPRITLADIRAIAQYRGWNLEQSVSWLGLRPAHVQELIQQDISENRPTSLR